MKTKTRYTGLQILAVCEARVARYTKMAEACTSETSRWEFAILQGKILANAELRDTIIAETPVLDYAVGDA